MFREGVTQTPFTSQAATEYFSRISGDSFNGDVSLVSTLRALIFPRLPEDDSIRVRFGSSSYNAAIIASTPARRMVEAICGQYYMNETGQFVVHSFNAAKAENNMANFALMRASFTTAYEGWQQFSDITELLKRKMNILCFINPEKKSTILFVEKLDLKKLHALQIAILGTLPWYYEMGTEISASERALLESFTASDPERYLQVLNDIYSQYDFEAMRLRRLLFNFETREARDELPRLRESIDENYRWIDSAKERVRTKLQEIDEWNARIIGLEESIERAKDGSELLDYFLCNRHLVLEDTAGTKLYFYVKDYIEYFDEALVRRVIDNSYSFVYTYTNEVITNERMKKLMRAVFLDEKIRIRVCAAYTFDIGGSVRAETTHDFGPDAATHLANPHINRYSCMGSYESKIIALLRNRNYIAALEQTVASAKSLNWADSTVMKEFFRILTGNSEYNNNNCCFELPDGSVVDTIHAIEWLERQEQAANETEGTNE